MWLALIRRPQGRKGEVFADILTDFPEKFAERRQLWLLRGSSGAGGATSAAAKASPAPREVELIGHWLHKGGIVLHFAGVDSISAAEELAGLVVAIPLAERATLAEDEVYIGDLIGCTLVDVGRGSTLSRLAESRTWTGPRGRWRCWWCEGADGRSARPVCEELPAARRSRGQARGDGAAGGARGAERFAELARAELA